MGGGGRAGANKLLSLKAVHVYCCAVRSSVAPDVATAALPTILRVTEYKTSFGSQVKAIQSFKMLEATDLVTEGNTPEDPSPMQRCCQKSILPCSPETDMIPERWWIRYETTYLPQSRRHQKGDMKQVPY